mgnify:CR=1 FL=1
MDMKKVSICIGCYNEEKNIENIYQKIVEIMERLPQYTFEIIFSDNDSQDDSQKILRNITDKDKRVKAIFNTRNFGATRSGRNGLLAATGDCAIGIACDFQEPPEMIPVFLEYWEEGNKLVWGEKVRSRENKVKYFFRSLYYSIIDSMSDIPQYRQVTGFGLYDRLILDEIRKANDPYIPIRFLIADLGFKIKLIPYVQEKRHGGKSSFSLWKYLDFSINSLVQTSTLPLRISTLLGILIGGVSFVIGLIYLICKLVYWDKFSSGMAPILIGLFFLGGIQLIFIGIVGEYVGAILKKLSNTPLVVEKEKINFGEDYETK